MLLLHGVKSNEAFDILKLGYPDKDHKCECYRRDYIKSECHCYATPMISDEISNGSSYCKTENGTIEKLSFFVVGGKKFEIKLVADEDLRKQKTDSREY